MIGQPEQLALLEECLLLTTQAVALADRAGASLASAILCQAMEAIERDRRRAGRGYDE